MEKNLASGMVNGAPGAAIDVAARTMQDMVSREDEKTMTSDAGEELTAEDGGSLPSNLELSSLPPWNPCTSVAPL